MFEIFWTCQFACDVDFAYYSRRILLSWPVWGGSFDPRIKAGIGLPPFSGFFVVGQFGRCREVTVSKDLTRTRIVESELKDVLGRNLKDNIRSSEICMRKHLFNCGSRLNKPSLAVNPHVRPANYRLKRVFQTKEWCFDKFVIDRTRLDLYSFDVWTYEYFILTYERCLKNHFWKMSSLWVL